MSSLPFGPHKRNECAIVHGRYFLIGVVVLLDGVWVDPIMLTNFAVVNPTLSMKIKIPPDMIPWGGRAPQVQELACAITLYYKLDPEHKRENWPAELFYPKDQVWPPDLSQYVTGNLREVQLYYFVGLGAPEDPILKYLGLPAMAIKLYIPKLKLSDLFFLMIDTAVSTHT